MEPATSPFVSSHQNPPHKIEIHLRELSQLFNSMDPSPFHEKDLDQDAEEFITSWAHEYHRREPVCLVLYLTVWPEGPDPQPLVEQAVITISSTGPS